MNQPHDSSPFDEMHVGPGEKLSEKMTAGKAVFGTLGLAIMGFGGLAVAVGYIMLRRPEGDDPLLHRGLGAVIGLLGVGMCHAGYWIFGCGRRRRRSPPEQRPREHPMKYQDKFRPSGHRGSLSAQENPDPHAIRSDSNHDPE
jgi:hypothetical protein